MPKLISLTKVPKCVKTHLCKDWRKDTDMRVPMGMYIQYIKLLTLVCKMTPCKLTPGMSKLISSINGQTRLISWGPKTDGQKGS